jgi:hypothetical protein
MNGSNPGGRGRVRRGACPEICPPVDPVEFRPSFDPVEFRPSFEPFEV